MGLLHDRAQTLRLSALHGTAIVAAWSMLLYLPIYLLFLEPALLSAQPSSLLFAMLYQGVLSSVVSLSPIRGQSRSSAHPVRRPSRRLTRSLAS